MADYRLTDDDKERVAMLQTVAKKGLKELSLKELGRLEELVQKKDYSHSKKAQKSKMRLLAKINVAVYEASEGRQGI